MAGQSSVCDINNNINNNNNNNNNDNNNNNNNNNKNNEKFKNILFGITVSVGETVLLCQQTNPDEPTIQPADTNKHNHAPTLVSGS